MDVNVNYLEHFKDCSNLIISLKDVFNDTTPEFIKACENFGKPDTFVDVMKLVRRIDKLCDALIKQGLKTKLYFLLVEVSEFLYNNASVGQKFADTFNVSIKFLRNKLFPNKKMWSSELVGLNIDDLSGEAYTGDFEDARLRDLGDSVKGDKNKFLKVRKELLELFKKWDGDRNFRDVANLRLFEKKIDELCLYMDLEKYPEITKRRDEFVKLCDDTCKQFE